MTREIIAILRGVQTHEICDIADALIDAGITKIEVPLNSPDPFATIALLVTPAGDRAIVGAGTLCDTDAVELLASIRAPMRGSPAPNAEGNPRPNPAGMVPTPDYHNPTP